MPAKPSDMHLAEIRALAERYSAEQIDRCMELALQHKDNPCFAAGEIDEVMNVLAKAEFVKAQVERGMTVAQALRELGRRIRAVQGG